MAQKAAAVSTVAGSGGVGFFEGGFADGAATRDAAVTSAELPGPSARRARALAAVRTFISRHHISLFEDAALPARKRARVDDRSSSWLALSVVQPFAWALVNGHKDVENRTKPPPRSLELPCWIAIHASRSALDEARHGPAAAIAARCSARGASVPPASELPRGAIVGAVRVVGCAPHGDARVGGSAWAIENHECWLVDRARALSAPIACRGSLGLWRAPAEAAAALDALLLGDAPENPPRRPPPPDCRPVPSSPDHGGSAGAGGDGGDGDDDYDRDTDDEDGRAAAAADDDARASGWGVGTNITICKPEAAFGRGVIVGHHPGAHELWRVELVPSQSKSGSVSVCAGAPRVRARSYFLTSREVERGLLQLGAA